MFWNGSSYNILTFYGLAISKLPWLSTGWTTLESEFEFRYGQEFSLPHIVQTGSGVHPTSYPMGTEVSFPRG
jgi:hypothetical protein